MAVPGPTLGVDFGTSNTVAVLRWPDGRTRALLFDGSPVLPSAVFAGDEGLATGHDAERSARMRPDAYEPNPKRRVDDGMVLLGGRELRVVDLFAAVLRRVWAEAVRVAGGPPASAVMTHPAAWGPPRCDVLARAAVEAGLPVPRLVPEPVAAAAYFVGPAAVRVAVGACIVVYDFGAGTFDASVVRRDPAGFTVLASEGLPDAGGIDVDAAIVGYLGATVVTRDPAAWQRLERPGTDADRRARRQLWDDVRAAKEALSRATSTYIHVPLVEDSLPLGREQLERLARPVLDRTVAATRLAIRSAGLTEHQIAGVFLVGGSSRMPLAATLLHRGLGRVPSAVEQPELVVADGSLYAMPPPRRPAAPPPRPAQAGPAQAGPAQAGPAQAGPAQAGPAQAGMPPGPPGMPPGRFGGGPGMPPERPSRRGRLVAVLAPLGVLVLVAAILLTVQPWHGRGATPGGSGTSPSAPVRALSISYEKADNQGPARRPAGARAGGTLTLLLDDTITHLDPAQVYSSEDWALGQLVFRTLTAVRTNGNGTGTLVGDLATDPGTDVDKDCRTWRFRLRPGLAYENGSPITSVDVAHGIARSFQSSMSDGATTLQQWLAGDANYTRSYQGPKSGGLPPGVSMPDGATIVLRFPKPHCDLPYAASLPTTAPVPASADGTSGFDRHPLASGPYRVQSNDGKTIVLARNAYWKGAGDPLRTADPDSLRVIEGGGNGDIVTRMRAGAGAEQTSLSWASASSFTGGLDAGTSARLIRGPIGYTMFLNINTRRVTDVGVRQAINYAVDKRRLLDGSVTDLGGTVATTIIPPAMAGHLSYPDPYPYSTAQATKLLAGRKVSLTLAVSTNATRGKQAAAIQKMLGDAGIEVHVTEVGDTTAFYAAVAKADNPYDLYIAAYEADWPTGYSMLSLMFDGRTVGTGSNYNLSLLDDQGVNAALDDLGALRSDPDSRAGALDKKLMTDLAPVVPLYYPAGAYLRGNEVGGTGMSNSFGLPSLTTVFVTS
jgi:peptide/nickel transport system substrate-binding protein